MFGHYYTPVYRNFPEFYQKIKTFTFNELNKIIKKFIDWYKDEDLWKNLV